MLTYSTALLLTFAPVLIIILGALVFSPAAPTRPAPKQHSNLDVDDEMLGQ